MAIEGVKAITAHPQTNRQSAMKIVIFLPSLSEIGPPDKDPIAAPKRVIETINSFWKLVTSWKVSFKYKLAPAITLVS